MPHCGEDIECSETSIDERCEKRKSERRIKAYEKE